MANKQISRRRFLCIVAATSQFAFSGSTAAFARPVKVWDGTALGAASQLVFDGLPDSEVKRVVGQVLSEVERLENVFSLYRGGSELSRLNRLGELSNPSHDMQVLLVRALAFNRRTDGAFNPAVQPLWKAVSAHFRKLPGTEPPRDMIQEALALCDPSGVNMGTDCIKLRSGMALTLNGIAQGYITDRVASLLRQSGLRHVLIDLGEMRALPGRSWDVGLGHDGRMRLAGRALATSEPAGTELSAERGWHHLFDPVTGTSAHTVRQVSVVARDATTADALSTALAVSSARGRKMIAARFPEAGIRTITAEGQEERVGPFV